MAAPVEITDADFCRLKNCKTADDVYDVVEPLLDLYGVNRRDLSWQEHADQLKRDGADDDDPLVEFLELAEALWFDLG